MKSARKKVNTVIATGKTKRDGKTRARAKEYVGYLLELHKLQGVLLAELDKKV